MAFKRGGNRGGFGQPHQSAGGRERKPAPDRPVQTRRDRTERREQCDAETQADPIDQHSTNRLHCK